MYTIEDNEFGGLKIVSDKTDKIKRKKKKKKIIKYRKPLSVNIGFIVFFAIFAYILIYMNTKGLDYTILTIAIIGAINWGLVGFFKLDLVNMIFGDMTIISRIIYAIIGLCGLYLVSLYGRVTNAMNN